MKKKLRKCEAQHGDVLLFKVDNKATDNLKEITCEENFIIEKGEGVHTHVLKNVTDCKVFVGENGELIVKPGKTTILDHEEHGPMTIKPFIKDIEQEFDYETFESRNTRD